MKHIFMILSIVGSWLMITSCNKNPDPKPDTSGKFIKFFGNAGMNRAYSLKEVSDGFILTGYSELVPGNKDILIVKTDKNGNRLWEKRVATPYNEIARHIHIENGTIWIAGTQFKEDGFSQALLLRLNQSGNLVETLELGGEERNEDAHHISFFPNGDFLVAGVTDSLTERNMFVARLSPDGTPLWNNPIGVIGQSDTLNRIAMLDNGNLAWCGTSVRAGGNKDIRCVMSTTDGTILWSYEYGLTTRNEYGRDVISNSDGGVTIIGSSGDNNAEKMFVLKLSANGAVLDESNPGQGTNSGFSISESSTGGYIATGFTKIDAENQDMTLIRLNESLGVEWEKTFGGKRRDQGYAVIEANDGFFTTAGFTDLFNNENNVFYLVKTDQNGEVNAVK